MQPSGLDVLPPEIWLEIMKLCDYKDICVLRMCAREFVMLAESVTLDKVMFRYGEEPVTNTPLLHPALKGLLFSGCCCPRSELKLQSVIDGFPSVGPLFDCLAHPVHSSINPDSSAQGAMKNTISLNSPTMVEYCTKPALNKLHIDLGGHLGPMDWITSPFVSSKRGVTVRQFYDTLFKILATKQKDRFARVTQHDRLVLHQGPWMTEGVWILSYARDARAVNEPYYRLA